MFVHGANLTQKENHQTKYQDPESRQYLRQIRKKYGGWHKTNMELVGPGYTPQDSDKKIIESRVQLFEKYKNFIDQQKYAEKFDSRSRLHSTVIEEFMFYLFKDLVVDFKGQSLIGHSRHTFKDIFFVPPNFKEMIRKPYARIEEKDHDFIIGTTIEARLVCHAPNQQTFFDAPVTKPIRERHNFDIPAVVIECKTYLDKTMLEGSSTAAEQLKLHHPNAIYIVVMEWIKLTEAVNLKKYKVDQIYILRKQKNIDREFRFLPNYQRNPIDSQLIWHLYKLVREHLSYDWEAAVQLGLKRGWLL